MIYTNSQEAFYDGKKRKETHPQSSDDRREAPDHPAAVALLLDNIPDDAKEKDTLVERILWFSKSEDLIVRCLTEYDKDNA